MSQNTVPTSFLLYSQLILHLGIKVKAFLKSVWNSLLENVQKLYITPHINQNILWWSLSIKIILGPKHLEIIISENKIIWKGFCENWQDIYAHKSCKLWHFRALKLSNLDVLCKVFQSTISSQNSLSGLDSTTWYWRKTLPANEHLSDSDQ